MQFTKEFKEYLKLNHSANQIAGRPSPSDSLPNIFVDLCQFGLQVLQQAVEEL